MSSWTSRPTRSQPVTADIEFPNLYLDPTYVKARDTDLHRVVSRAVAIPIVTVTGATNGYLITTESLNALTFVSSPDCTQTLVGSGTGVNRSILRSVTCTGP